MEMKKSYSPFGSTPLSVDEVLSDIQTGRAVYPDKDKEADASYMERINQYKHEGFHDVSGDGGSSSGGDSSSGGGGAPLILEVVSAREATAEECEDGGGVVYTYNHTWQEVHDALLQGTMVFYHTNNDMGFEEYGIVRSVGFNATTNEYVVDDLVASAPTDVLKAVECGRQ